LQCGQGRPPLYPMPPLEHMAAINLNRSAIAMKNENKMQYLLIHLYYIIFIIISLYIIILSIIYIICII
jgi:hypothetical protein